MGMFPKNARFLKNCLFQVPQEVQEGEALSWRKVAVQADQWCWVHACLQWYCWLYTCHSIGHQIVKTASAPIYILQDVLGMIKSFATARWFETCTDGGFSPDAQIAGGLVGRPHQATVTISIFVWQNQYRGSILSSSECLWSLDLGPKWEQIQGLDRKCLYQVMSLTKVWLCYKCYKMSLNQGKEFVPS